MSGFNYPGTAATATRLLKRFGAPAALIRADGPPVYDPETGSTAPADVSTPTTAGVFAYDQKFIDNTLILQGDQLAYCVPGVEPRQGDRFQWRGKVYAVISVKPIAPAGTPVLFEAQLRG